MLNFPHHQLLVWYEQHRRDLPWRLNTDPYRIWISEIMLQQTTVTTVIPYFQRWMQRWPALQDLWTASEPELVHMWQGLGYYRRAQGIFRCAQTLKARWSAQMPIWPDNLQELPGIGPYTAAAMEAIIHNQPVIALDGNTIRVLSRWLALDQPQPAAQKWLRTHQKILLNQPVLWGDWTQAIMDLARRVCTPRNPSCSACPLQTTCRGKTAPEAYPHPVRRTSLVRYGWVAWLTDKKMSESDLDIIRHPPHAWPQTVQPIIQSSPDEKSHLFSLSDAPTKVLLFPQTTLWSGTWLPWMSPWTEIPQGAPDLPWPVSWSLRSHLITHVLTHRTLHLTVIEGLCPQAQGTWVPLDRLGSYPQSTLMRKIIAIVAKTHE